MIGLTEEGDDAFLAYAGILFKCEKQV